MQSKSLSSLPAKHQRPPAFEKVPFEDAASILWKHVTARRFRFVYHYHPEIELIYFAQGGGIEFVGGSGQVFNPGHLVLLGSNLPHLWINDAKCHYAEICVVQFKPELFGEHLLVLPELSRLKVLIDAASKGVEFSSLIASQIGPLLMRLGAESGAKRLLTLFEILVLLSRDTQSRTLCTNAHNHQHEATAEQKRRINQVYHYLNEHFRDSCSVSEVAKAAGMSPTAFSRFFRHETGRTLVEVLIELRISYACKLLRDTDKNIAEIAYECGYSNLANFNRQFRWRCRMTPKTYRKHWPEEEAA
jgi:AraC-like DNA-binding protein/quercetin dioxygenase-like cupin family protein